VNSCWCNLPKFELNYSRRSEYYRDNKGDFIIKYCSRLDGGNGVNLKVIPSQTPQDGRIVSHSHTSMETETCYQTRYENKTAFVRFRYSVQLFN
jgi:hypothetical protein